ncbi:MAG: tRNA threonylcarbamoyladenosine dehydratase [Clostridia bacterium]|nr:tRNA threonylcarbamoyladenosine dehydratase [Clostridia bacterium]
MQNQFTRTELLIGKDGLKKLQNAKVAVYGVGGVGSYVVEGLARAGIGHLVLIDNDYVDITNINRQIHATHSTIGKSKVEIEKERILEINPNVIVDIYQVDTLEKPEEEIIDSSFTYVVDAVDTITTKLKLIQKANKENVPIISAMGTANKLDPTRFEVSDIYKTSVCPLCKVMRKELKNRNIPKLKVVYSKEEPIKVEEIDGERILGSISFVPSVAGLIVAGEVIKDIIKN